MNRYFETAWETWPLARWRTIAALLIMIALCPCPFIGAMMMAEGPHGPNGEITTDPSAEWKIPFMLACSALCFIAGAMIWNKANYIEAIRSDKQTPADENKSP